MSDQLRRVQLLDGSSRKRSQDVEAGPSRLVPSGTHHGKRPRLTPEEDVRSPADPADATLPINNLPQISDTALLFHTALSAHHASQQHLQQAFIPSWVQSGPSTGHDAIPLYASPRSSSGRRPLSPDRSAAQKASALQLLALDLLAIGLRRDDLSDSERAAFSIELVTVGLKIREAQKSMDRKGKGRALGSGFKVDLERLTEDMQRSLAAAIVACDRNSQLVASKQRLEWLNVRLALMEDRVNMARRTARQYLSRCQQFEHTHRYALYFLLLDKAAATDCGEALSLIEEVWAEAEKHGHRQILQILALIRCRLLFVYRRWDTIPSALDGMAKLFNWAEGNFTFSRLSTEAPIWYTVFTAHYFIFRSLWEGRIGSDGKARSLLKRLYLLMDEATETGSLEELRRNGGLIRVDGFEPPLYVQTTTPNALFRLTYMATVTSRRDYVGSETSCKSLIHIRAMREFELTAKKDDLWDAGFGVQHGLAEVWAMQDSVVHSLAEIMLEEATAMLVRSNFVSAEKVLIHLSGFAHIHNLMDDLGPHLCLGHAMMAQFLGHDMAVRYYQAALCLLEDGSELGLMIEASLMGAQNDLFEVKADHAKSDKVKDLASKCKMSSSMALNTIGQILSALADDNLMTSKKKIGGAYDLCQQSNNNLLRALIFAFTSSTHLTGSEERVQKQLETGLDIAALLGGKDRVDQVGQPVLGLWFAVRLRQLHHRNQDGLALSIARSKIQRYNARLTEIMEFSEKKYSVTSGLEWMRHELE